MSDRFGLFYGPRGDWVGTWNEGRIRVRVEGAVDAPNAGQVARLTALVDRWAEVSAEIAAFGRALDRVVLQAPLQGGFASSSCGFDGELFYEAIMVREEDVRVTFYTGYPDGYATFEARLHEGRVVEITAFAS
ncbi:MAG: hypothetical protein SFX73_36225 [Kofleriaceae bacterium]|nr:hypothetical protein [Kofleriaceae bacterium]